MIDFNSPDQIEQYFKSIEKQLLNPSNLIPFRFQRMWLNSFPKEAGVYCFFVNDEICYVGETGCICKRLADLFDSRNHTLRRSIGEKYFGSEDGYVKANSSRKFPPQIEKKVEDWMSNHLKFSFVTVKIGRKEFEEWLQNSNPSISFLNKRTKRK